MKYETPKLTMLAPAISAVQSNKRLPINVDSPQHDEAVSAYEDNE